MTIFDLWYDLISTYILTSNAAVDFGYIPVLFAALLTFATVWIPVRTLVRALMGVLKK
jgi:hypothetical protein